MITNYSVATASLALAFGLAGTARAQNIPNLPELVDAVIPAVVSVNCNGKNNAQIQLPPLEELLKEKPGASPENQKKDTPADPLKRKGTGTGFVLDSGKGYILTNQHVIENCDSIKVSLNGDRRLLPATILGQDSTTDVAVIKIKENVARTQATLGDSHKIRLGESVFAIGHPFGFTETVTTGIVSGKKRVAEGSYDDLIQTDTAINPGNSGGPLFNEKGHVIAMNSSIFSVSGQYAGISLAIPINQAKWVADKLIEKGSVPWGFLGAGIALVNEEEATKAKRSDLKGVWITSVMKDSAASGLIKEEDIVLRVNGVEVNTPQELARLVGETMSGNTARLDVWRNGQAISRNVTLRGRPVEDTLIKTLRP